MKSTVSAIALASAIFASQANATDLKNTSDPTSVASENSAHWAGLYAGVHGGWSDWSFERPDDKSSPTQDIDGYFGGAQIGYDFQVPGSSIVVGVVADAAIGDLQGDTYKDGTYITLDTEIDAFGTIRGRVGYAFGRFLPYVTGGAAWVAGSTSEHCPKNAYWGHCKTAGAYDDTDEFTRWGFAYGAGVEAKVVDHVSVFAEYLRLDFGTETHDLGSKSSDRDVRIDNVDVFKAGLNYRF